VVRRSLQQISDWLQQTYSDIEEMQVSHETIYLTWFIQARGGLKRQLAQHLRARRANPRPKGAKPPRDPGGTLVPLRDALRVT
jgi:IS30 family transposase